MSELSAKEKSFVEAYCSSAKFNGAMAARAAGYSEKTARSKASQLLTKVNIQDAIQEFMSNATERALVTTEDIVRGLYDIAQHGESDAARVSAYKTLTDYTGGFDKNKQKIDHTSNGESINKPTVIQLVSPDDSSSN